MRRKTIQPTGRESPFDVEEIIVSKTDPKGRITYANAVFQRVSGYAAQELIGQSIDAFHRSPERQRALIDGLSGTHRSQLRPGGRSFDPALNPVLDEAGQRLGTVVEWQDITRKLQAEEEIAVVATEVRTLAQRSAQAAKEIKALIQESGAEVRGGVRLVGEAGPALTGIVASIKAVALIVRDIAAAGVDRLNVTMTAMDGMTQQNAALVEESTAAARSLEEQAQSLTAAMADFTIAPKVGDDLGRPPARAASPAAQVHAAAA